MAKPPSVVTDSSELDRLRKACAASLDEFIRQARETDRFLQQLGLPIVADEDMRLESQRKLEFRACEEYLLHCQHLTAFLKLHREYVQ